MIEYNSYCVYMRTLFSASVVVMNSIECILNLNIWLSNILNIVVWIEYVDYLILFYCYDISILNTNLIYIMKSDKSI